MCSLTSRSLRKKGSSLRDPAELPQKFNCQGPFTMAAQHNKAHIYISGTSYSSDNQGWHKTGDTSALNRNDLQT
jgi:hypothetical protein